MVHTWKLRGQKLEYINSNLRIGDDPVLQPCFTIQHFPTLRSSTALERVRTDWNVYALKMDSLFIRLNMICDRTIDVWEVNKNVHFFTSQPGAAASAFGDIAHIGNQF